MSDTNLEFHNRLTAFQEGYRWEECDALVHSLAIVGEMLETAFDKFAGARGMQALQLVIATSPEDAVNWTALAEADASLNWRQEWADLDAIDATCWSDTLSRAHDLSAFAFFGILPGWDLPDPDVQSDQFVDVPRHVRTTIGRLTDFVALFPKGREESRFGAVLQSCLAAEARLKIDEGTALSVHELAAVTNVTTKRLQNAIYAKTEDAPILGRDGLIPVESAARWLKAREYVPSIWQEYVGGRCWEGDLSTTSTPSEELPELEPEQYLFVPEARDGTVFSPNHCRRPEVGYTIGSKGAERHFTDYAEALAALVSMPRPHWRRPNGNGVFGIVSAERWRRLSQRELDAI
jgi:hypothetical protein